MTRARLAFACALAAFPIEALAADPSPQKDPITTHVLDTSLGKPAAGVAVALQRRSGKLWEEVGESRTNADGRADRLYPRGRALERGTYKLVYRTAEYFKARGVETFFPTVEVVFEVRATGEHYHVPLLLGPFSYGTYRGS